MHHLTPASLWYCFFLKRRNPIRTSVILLIPTNTTSLASHHAKVVLPGMMCAREKPAEELPDPAECQQISHRAESDALLFRRHHC
ncbi:hypothetical protein E2C01_013134 [Portunus trituberculatus]|uniref:Uncharacterized protein n=1 Tax=Portunus trituberculatus TaxID=210409 RepID=A0A5B7DG98_PORTR|nr:hypothetical protein [Portunus trituberculatus]